MTDIGIRREDKNTWERRVPFTPSQVERLVARGLSVEVQRSPIRIFADDDYRAAGASLTEGMPEARAIVAVKEIPIDLLQPGQTYLFFAHVIKGQPHNMPLLRRLLELRCTLIDYERIVGPDGKRLVYFSRHAGYAGMIDGLWALGERLASEGIASPFADVMPAWCYADSDEAIRTLEEQLGAAIALDGVPREVHPLVVGFTGGGNVSGGAQEVLDCLPVTEISPAELPTLADRPDLDRRRVYKVIFRRSDRVDFARHLPYLTMLVNGIYWQAGHPTLADREELAALWSGGTPKLRIIADLSCDIPGPIAATVKATSPDAPVYVWDPETRKTRSGVEGRGPVVLAVDNLPCELPRDASRSFGRALLPFVQQLVAADFGLALERLELPPELAGAVITHHGELAPAYRDLADAMVRAGA